MKKKSEHWLQDIWNWPGSVDGLVQACLTYACFFPNETRVPTTCERQPTYMAALPGTLAGRGLAPPQSELESAVVIIVTRRNSCIFWQMASPLITRRFWGLLKAPPSTTTCYRLSVCLAGVSGIDKTTLVAAHEGMGRTRWTCVTISLPSSFSGMGERGTLNEGGGGGHRI